MTQQSLNMASGAPKILGAQYSSGIKSKYKFEYKYGLRSDLRAPNFNNFSWGSMPIIGAPPNRKYLPPPMCNQSIVLA